MWNCNNCGNQNEENFNFCWSCGKPRSSVDSAKQKPNTDIPVSKPMEFKEKVNIPPKIETKQPETPKAPERKKPEMVVIQPIKHETPKVPAKNVEIKEETPKQPEIIAEKKAVEIVKEKKESKTKTREPELFSTFLPESERGKVFTEAETDWETILFTTAVRIVGLYFIFLVLTSIPALVSEVYSFINAPNAEITSLSELFANPLFVLLAKVLFYLILGIYLIASGRIIIWFLPRK